MKFFSFRAAEPFPPYLATIGPSMHSSAGAPTGARMLGFLGSTSQVQADWLLPMIADCKLLGSRRYEVAMHASAGPYKLYTTSTHSDQFKAVLCCNFSPPNAIFFNDGTFLGAIDSATEGVKKTQFAL